MAKRGRPRKSDVSKFKYEIGDVTFGGQRHTLEETAKELKMTKQGVLAIERRALEKLRVALAKMGIKSLNDILDPAMISRQTTLDAANDFNAIGA